MVFKKNDKISKLNKRLNFVISAIILPGIFLFSANAEAFIAADRTVKIMEDKGGEQLINAGDTNEKNIGVKNDADDSNQESDGKISYKIKNGEIVKEQPVKVTDKTKKTKTDDIFLEGYKNYKEKNFDDAIKYLKMAIIENPQNFLAYFYLSNIYLEKRMYDEANDVIETANNLKMAAADREALVREGMSEISETDSLKYKEAADSDYKKAMSLAGEGRWMPAIQALKNAINLDPANEIYYIKLGEIYSDSKNLDKAADCFDKALTINPENQNALKRLARHYASKKQSEKANEYYSKLYQVTGDKSYLKKLNQDDKANPAVKNEKNSFLVLKRRGNTIYVNNGYENGLKMGDQIKKKLLVYKSKSNSELRDPRTSKVIGYEKPILVGELMITQIDDKYCESIITSELNGGINVGDDVKWKE